MSKINKIITNYPVELTPEEVENLSLTLSAVRTAGGGGGSEGKIYHGVGFVTVNNTYNEISLTTEANEKLNQSIPTKVSDLTDSADYQTVAGMSDYSTKSVADTLYAPISVTGDVDTLKTSSGDWDKVSEKLDTTAFSTVSGNFLTEVPAGYATETWVENKHYLSAVPDTYYTKSQTSGADQLAAAFGNILDYDVTAAAGIEITTATDNGTTTFGISMTAEPVVTDTNLSGYNGIAAAPDGTKSGWWNVGLTQDMLNTINGKLDSSDFTTYTGTTAPNTYLTKTSADTLYQPTGDYVTTADVLTGTSDTLTGIKIGSTDYTIPTTDLSDYYTKTEVDSTFASASQLNSYLTTAQYQTDSAKFLTSVVTAGSLSGNGTTNSPLGLKTSAEQALSAVANKLEPPPHNTQQSTNYIWSDPLGQGIPGWIDANNWLDEALENTEFLHAEDLRWYISPENGVSGKWDNEEEELKLGIDTTNMSANKQYAFTTTGWEEVSTSTIPDITATNGISADGYKIGLTESVYSAIQEISAASDLVGANGISVVTGLNNQIIIEPSGISPSKQYAMTTTGWAEVQAGTTFTGVTTTGSISGGGVNNDTIGLLTSAENALTAVAEKLDTTAASQTYLDKTTYATDSATFVTSSNSTITGTKQYALTTAGWAVVSTPTIPDITANNGLSANGHTIGIDNTNLVADTQYAWSTTGWASVETAYLPLTGGTVTGQMTLTGNGWDTRLTIGRSNTAIDIGVASNGALTLKANANNACQFNMMQTGTSGVDINITYGQTPTAIGNLYVMKTHTTAEATTASGSWNGDNLLHIILDS